MHTEAICKGRAQMSIASILFALSVEKAHTKVYTVNEYAQVVCIPSKLRILPSIAAGVQTIYARCMNSWDIMRCGT